MYKKVPADIESNAPAVADCAIWLSSAYDKNSPTGPEIATPVTKATLFRFDIPAIFRIDESAIPDGNLCETIAINTIGPIFGTTKLEASAAPSISP